jgi:formylglycine-generating enzyme required for sulfatase activity
MKLTLIPAGEFMMGSKESNADLEKAFGPAAFEHDYSNEHFWDFSDESPPHKVRITKPFYMGTYPVTVGQFLTYAREAPYTCDSVSRGWGASGYDPKSEKKFSRGTQFVWWSWGFPGQTPDHPVVDVTWDDARLFCAWLSKKEGQRYRLPTEAEWEYACRAGTTTRFYNGDDPRKLVLVGNVADAAAKKEFPQWKDTAEASDGHAFTAPVGKFKPNAFGLYDMHGNAYQWCSDWYGEHYYAHSPVDDPQGPSELSPQDGLLKFRVVRGGSWRPYPIYCRASNRVSFIPGLSDCRVGFRVVRER